MLGFGLGLNLDRYMTLTALNPTYSIWLLPFIAVLTCQRNENRHSDRNYV